MAVVPLVLFGVPALFGHAAIAQDNLIQNFPLRVLTGQQFRSWHLPLFNPLADTGTPLLGGMNAGSFFPMTFAFVVLPPIAAWVLNLVAIYVGAALGVFALLRWHGLRTLPSAVAALVFAYSGSMIGQMVHLGVVQGYALMPWLLLALLTMATRLREAPPSRDWRGRARLMATSVAGVAVTWGLACLSGEPRAIAEAELLTVIVVPMVVLVSGSWQPRHWLDRAYYVIGVGVGILWGAMIGLGQLLPGWNFITQSQRSSISYSYFGAGSLPVRWSAMMFDQTILGGNGLLHQPTFFSNYNLPEVTGYVGVLALVGVAAFLTRVTRRGWRPGDRDYVIYLGIVVVGLLATWGGFTPLGHLFQQLPLFGSTRLQSRNIVMVDLGASVLLGWWLDRLTSREFDGAGLLGWRRWITMLPALATMALALGMLVVGPRIARFMGAWPGSVHMASFERPTVLLQLALGASIVVVLTWGVRHQRLVRWLVVIATLDVLVFMLFSSTGFVAGHVNVMPSRASAVSRLGGFGRFALVDPSGDHLDEFENLGSPNMNVFTEVPSVQGYGSLIDSVYGNVTASHPLFSLNPCHLADGTFIQLRLAAVAVSSSQLATPFSLQSTPALRCLPLKRQVRTQRYFGQMLRVRTILVEGSKGRPVSRGSVTARLLSASGRPFGLRIVQQGALMMFFNFNRVGRLASGVQIDAPEGALISSTIVDQPGPETPSYQLNTPFQQALSSSLWRVAGTSGTITIFKATRVRPTAWLGSHQRSSKLLKIKNSGWGDSWITVHAVAPTVLKRSDAWLPGWRATAVNQVSGAHRSLVVDRSGLIEQVVVPTGTWQVHFHYHAPYIEAGLAGSALGTMALIALWVQRRGWLRRRRDGKVRA